MAYLISRCNAVYTDANTAKKAANIESISRFDYTCPSDVSIDPPFVNPIGFMVSGEVEAESAYGRILSDRMCAKPIYNSNEIEQDSFDREYNFHCLFTIYFPFHGENCDDYRKKIRIKIREMFDKWWEENKEKFLKEDLEIEILRLVKGR